MAASSDFTWKFHRIGGLDQVTLRSAAELCHIGELDPKLWGALSCPASGLEFDQRTLSLIDADGDGRIRIQEVTEAVEWACARLADPAVMVDPPEALPLAHISSDTEEGRRLAASARAILENIGKGEAEEITREDVEKAAEQAAQNLLNGDGVVPLHPDLDSDMQQFIQDALAVTGGVEDAGGETGINRPIAEAFVRTLEAWRGWKTSVTEAAGPLNADTEAAWELVQELKGKIDDYFLRCDLADFAPHSTDALAAEEKTALPAEKGLLDAHTLEDLPLARVEAGRPLQLASGLNPAWRERMERFFHLVRPLLAQPGTLTREDWLAVLNGFASHEAALALKPAPEAAEVSVAPTGSPDDLGLDRVNALLSGDLPARFAELAEQDASALTDAAGVAAVERLVLYHRHLHRLLMNFVSFYDFYSLRRNATFQAGTLFLDGRSCRLCLPVADLAKHSTLAVFSQLYLIYCECRRPGKEGADDETMTIVAAMTAGDSDLLLDGRNGVFVDSMGNSWDATLVKIVSNPISLRQALWEPYKRLGRMITEQIAKFASAKQAAQTASMGQKMQAAATSAPAPAGAGAPPAAGFDIGKNVGILAAVGLALGALGTAVASIANALFSLAWWQFPLLIIGLFLVISGPSLTLAWLKLRKRTLGPLLDASGWAVNSRIPVNLTMGGKLTDTAVLPPNSSRSFRDPLAQTRRWPLVAGLLVVLALAALGCWLWFGPWKTHLFPAETNATQQVAGNATALAPAKKAPPAAAKAADPASAKADEPAPAKADAPAATKQETPATPLIPPAPAPEKPADTTKPGA